MNWVRAMVGVLVLWSSTAWGATLTWTPNHEVDVAGYRVYQCSQQPCTRTSGHASLLATLGKTTSFNIGTSAVPHYYFITAHDFSNKESDGSNVVIFPPPPPMAPVTLTVVGYPATGPWGVKATTTDHRDLMATVRLDGAVHHVDPTAPYSFPGDNGTTTTTGLFGLGSHTVEFEFYLEGTTTVSGRACVTVHERSPPSVGAVSLTVVGNPATGPWGVKATTTDHRDLMATVHLDGAVHHVEHTAPYSFPGDNGTTTTTEQFGIGWHTVEFEFYLEGTTTKIGRGCVSVHEMTS
jgi:hypothetical protein